MATPEWFDFRAPDYDRVYKLRAERLQRISTQPELLPGLMEHYKAQPTDFISDWGCTVDPRLAEVGLTTTVPFLLFARQEEFVCWLVERWKARGDGLVEKSRDTGASWLCVAVAV